MKPKKIYFKSLLKRERERIFYYSDKYINIYNVLNIKHLVPSPIGLVTSKQVSASVL